MTPAERREYKRRLLIRDVRRREVRRRVGFSTYPGRGMPHIGRGHGVTPDEYNAFERLDHKER